jgi:heme A synthase
VAPSADDGRREVKVARVAAGLAMAIGCALGGWTILRALDAKPPPAALIVGLLAAAALEIVTGVLILARARAGWAFAVSLNGLLAVAAVLALPALVRGGISIPVASGALGTLIVL